MEVLELFDIKPKKNTEKIEQTNIEYVQLAFSDGDKRKFFEMLEKLVPYDEVYENYLINLLEKEIEKNCS